MNRNVIAAGFFFSFAFMVVAAIFKILHIDHANTYLTAGLLGSYICLSIALYEVLYAKKMKRGQRLWWLVSFIATGWFALLIYAVATRKKSGNNPAARRNS